MRKEKATNVFLFFVFQAMLFIWLFPIYFSVGKIHERTVTLPERMFSLVFVLLWLALCVYSAWKKRLPLLVGGAMYSIMAYLPGWFLPGLAVTTDGVKNQGLVSSMLRLFFEKMYELVNAPLAGISLLVSQKASTSLSRYLLPILLLSYLSVHLFRFYRNAYLAEQLHLEENAYFSNPALARELAFAPGTVIPDAEAARDAPAVQPLPEAQQLPETLQTPETQKIPVSQQLPKILRFPAAANPAADENNDDDSGETRLHVPILRK